jgi:hypothetical protein
MDAYKGSPDYVRAGFLADLLGPWCNVEGSELGTHLTALHHAAETSLSIEEHKRDGASSTRAHRSPVGVQDRVVRLRAGTCSGTVDLSEVPPVLGTGSPLRL